MLICVVQLDCTKEDYQSKKADSPQSSETWLTMSTGENDSKDDKAGHYDDVDKNRDAISTRELLSLPLLP